MKKNLLIKSVGITLLMIALSGCAVLKTLEEMNRESAENEQDRSPATELQIQRITIQQAMHERDLVLGMSMQEVRQAWGEPRDIEIAGDSRHGNQRWLYPTGLSSRWSTSASRVVYFESGQVAGWDTLQ